MGTVIFLTCSRVCEQATHTDFVSQDCSEFTLDVTLQAWAWFAIGKIASESDPLSFTHAVALGKFRQRGLEAERFIRFTHQVRSLSIIIHGILE
jgi:hypothetical protein